ncbi:uncharacterized protein LOC122792476 [Protopterus annectens]|uniref:uncharacterized protein LOC122792476 n=1 Tax=Protopterus annectens TaxID=7888 RepID=UPI001CFA88CB|nr:uncharacterized protein LOC122792476 [Protopterus annectens]
MLSLDFMYLLALAFSSILCEDVSFGKNNYMEYRKGNFSIILTAPHGGSVKPSAIPNRDSGCWDKKTSICHFTHVCPAGTVKDPASCGVSTVSDMNTLEITLEIAAHIHRITGHYPHVVINHLHRSKLDPNREKDEAAFGIPLAEQTWDEFMAFIELAKSQVSEGLLLDIHGHTHEENWTELGYTISKQQLNSGTFNPNDSSIAHLWRKLSTVSYNDLLRGNRSLGKFIEDQENKAYICVPSPTYPSPGKGNYFIGGYITRTFGSKYSGTIDAIQIELPKSMRNDKRCPKQCPAVAQAIIQFWQVNYCNQHNNKILGC